MSDARKPSGRTVSSPGTPAVPSPAGQGRPPVRASNPALNRVTNPGMKVLSAARAQPPEAERKLVDRIRSDAENAALNAASILKEAYADFKHSNRYFKYKALIIASWVALSSVTLIISCPGSGLDAGNHLGARLAPLPTDPTRPAITIINDSDEPWRDVMIIVNQEYRAAIPQVDPHGGYVTVTPKQLIGPGGKLAPPDIRPYDLELRTDDGRVKLMKDGVTQ